MVRRQRPFRPAKNRLLVVRGPRIRVCLEGFVTDGVARPLSVQGPEHRLGEQPEVGAARDGARAGLVVGAFVVLVVVVAHDL